MHPPMPEYDLVVIGSGPGGQKAAIAAAKLGKSVAVIEHDRMLGGECTNTGTIPSKTLREAVVYREVFVSAPCRASSRLLSRNCSFSRSITSLSRYPMCRPIFA
jgi:pyruvate/2-oxoglutarate dehydrogenase complex dihydrolipoamide dehydrogenase (E3) component